MNAIPNLRERIISRPRIVKDPIHGYRCFNEFVRLVGFGASAKEAWTAWKVRDQRTVRIPRQGRWNKRDCMRWFNNGCYLINSWIGDKVIYGYDPTTDELILKG